MNRFLSWIRVLRFDYSCVPSVPSTFDAVLLVCLRCLRIYGLVSVACSCNPTFIAYPPGLPIVRYRDWFFRHVWYLVLYFPGACALITLTFPAQVLVVALRSVAEVAAFSPNTRFFSLVWGFLFLLKVFARLRLYSLAALVVWLFRSVCLSYA